MCSKGAQGADEGARSLDDQVTYQLAQVQQRHQPVNPVLSSPNCDVRQCVTKKNKFTSLQKPRDEQEEDEERRGSGRRISAHSNVLKSYLAGRNDDTSVLFGRMSAVGKWNTTS